MDFLIKLNYSTMSILKKTTLTILSLFAFVGVILAQGDAPFADLPPTSEYGKCYAKCKIPDVYESVTSQKVKKEASTKLIKVPAQYETATERIMVKEGGVKYKTIPATYKTVTETIEVVPASTKIRTVPAKYRTETRQILVSPAGGQWVRKKKSPGCFSQNPEDCYVACYEEIPAKYKTESYQVLSTPATTTQETIPAKYKTITKRVVDRPARVEEIPVEPQYKTVSKKVLVSPATTREEVIPATYSTVSTKQLVRAGGYTVWTEILCAEKTTSSKVRAVQRALAAAGYSPGVADGVMGSKTQTALAQYQTDKGLPVGNMNLETLRALGVEN